MKRCFTFFLLVAFSSAQTGQTGAMLGLSNPFTVQQFFNVGITVGPITFATLGNISNSTTMIFISDGALGSSPCAGGGTGALALRINGAWNCSAGFVSSSTLYYQTVDANGTAQTQRPTLNLISGSNATVTCVDNAGATRTDCTIASTGGGGGVTGSGTAGTLPKWTSSTTLGNSKYLDQGGTQASVTLNGTGTAGVYQFLVSDSSQFIGICNVGTSFGCDAGGLGGIQFQYQAAANFLFNNSGTVTPVLAIDQVGGFQTLTSSNSDLAGQLTFSASTTSSTYSFQVQDVTSPPICTITPLSDPGSGVRIWISTLSNSTLRLTASSSITLTVDYVCVGRI